MPGELGIRLFGLAFGFRVRAVGQLTISRIGFMKTL